MTISKPVDGSLRTVFRFSFPLMLTFFSMNLMVFFDRLFLSQYSVDALNDAICAGNLCWALSFPWIILVDIVEVFVAQYNGAQSYEKMGEAVWQTIWLSLIVCIIFFFMGEYGSQVLFDTKIFDTGGEVLYFKWNCYFTPGLMLFSAVGSFYTGQGKTKVVAALVILGNVVNIVLDYLLIFGVDGYILPLGLEGAIIATGSGIFFQIAIIVFLFLRKKNRKFYGTTRWFFNLDLFTKVIKLGSPSAILIYFELLGWTVFLWMMKNTSPTHILVIGICQSILQLFLCFGTGLEEGIIGVVGNLIGSKQFSQITHTFRSGLIFVILFTCIVSLFLIAYPKILINEFTQHADNEIRSILYPALILVTIYLTVENIRWLLKGMLIAVGDTMYLMKTGLFCTWFFLVLPIYLFVFLFKADVLIALSIWIFYSMSMTLFTYVRFLQKKWEMSEALA